MGLSRPVTLLSRLPLAGVGNMLTLRGFLASELEGRMSASGLRSVTAPGTPGRGAGLLDVELEGWKDARRLLVAKCGVEA
jgi:hypothetical protein